MRVLADENFDNNILVGLRRALPNIDVIRVQDTEIFHASDPAVLEWAAREGRIVLTHDIQTMAGFAVNRVKAVLPMPGVIEVAQDYPIGRAIEELSIIIGAGSPDDFESQVKFVPMF